MIDTAIDDSSDPPLEMRVQTLLTENQELRNQLRQARELHKLLESIMDPMTRASAFNKSLRSTLRDD